MDISDADTAKIKTVIVCYLFFDLCISWLAKIFYFDNIYFPVLLHYFLCNLQQVYMFENLSRWGSKINIYGCLECYNRHIYDINFHILTIYHMTKSINGDFKWIHLKYDLRLKTN